ncbi:OLC1v1002055C1 [Oldenlandia corymbosa var. corymbosa]|uniref:OLC1v1002055C1 n=1 Tax=Oldenlandia corymbosa var. corymbosa TaxID=529605 RepID=A0AAV1D6U7_OLDCO|nr:OLC1v1002055C1 [Oldenlandia corymbosa var. corymbosa]
MSLLRLFFVVLAVLECRRLQLVTSHEESGDWHCEPDSESRVVAEFKPGVVTLDGHADDWEDVYGFDFPLLPALDPDQDKAYNGGKMTVKALHDGKDVFFLMQVDGDYVYSKGNNNGCPSVALMFQVGDSATYHDMGGCKESPGTCNRTSCRGYEVDIMHFSLGNAVPGRLYGGNPIDNQEGNGGDRFGHLVDLYAWNPHCRNLDGISSSGNDTAQNDWRGSWWHSSFTTHSGFVAEDSPYTSSKQKGTYFFEFSRPLRTMDRLQQDVQFTIGQSSKFSAAFWYPTDGHPWHGSGHYSISCDWVSLDVAPGSSSSPVKGTSGSAWGAASGFALLFSFVAFCISVFVGYRVADNKSIAFTPMDRL